MTLRDRALGLLRAESDLPLADVEVVPDPAVDGVALVFDHGAREAVVVYVDRADFEEADSYEEAARKYSARGPRPRSAREEAGTTAIQCLESAMRADYSVMDDLRDDPRVERVRRVCQMYHALDGENFVWTLVELVVAGETFVGVYEVETWFADVYDDEEAARKAVRSIS